MRPYPGQFPGDLRDHRLRPMRRKAPPMLQSPIVEKLHSRRRRPEIPEVNGIWTETVAIGSMAPTPKVLMTSKIFKPKKESVSNRHAMMNAASAANKSPITGMIL